MWWVDFGVMEWGVMCAAATAAVGVIGSCVVFFFNSLSRVRKLEVENIYYKKLSMDVSMDVEHGGCCTCI